MEEHFVLLLHSMSKGNVILEKKSNQSLFLVSKHLKKIFPFGSGSSFSLSLSHNSNDSSLTDQLDHKVSLALTVTPPRERRGAAVAKNAHHRPCPAEIRRCSWITKNTDEAYVSFHDECWGIPVYDDDTLFELLTLSGMLMDCNWTHILKRRALFKEAFRGFDPKIVAKMGEEEIEEVANNPSIMLPSNKVRCIVDNAKCTLKIAKDFGSFRSYMWAYVNYKTVINRYKYLRNVPLRTPKAEAISNDLQKRGFRFVGPVIVYSFMQAAGLTIDHTVDCYRYGDCVRLAERP